MYPHERSLVRRLADKPFAIIGVNSDRDLDRIRETVKEKSITWRSFWNGEQGTRGPISTEWNVTGWPTTYLIDAKGVIRYKNLRGNALDEALEVLMAEMGEDVELVGIDHEEEDAAALEAAKKAAENTDSEEADESNDAKSEEAESAESKAETDLDNEDG